MPTVIPPLALHVSYRQQGPTEALTPTIWPESFKNQLKTEKTSFNLQNKEDKTVKHKLPSSKDAARILHQTRTGHLVKRPTFADPRLFQICCQHKNALYSQVCVDAMKTTAASEVEKAVKRRKWTCSSSVPLFFFSGSTVAICPEFCLQAAEQFIPVCNEISSGRTRSPPSSQWFCC